MLLVLSSILVKSHSGECFLLSSAFIDLVYNQCLLYTSTFKLYCVCDSDFMKVARRLTIIESTEGRLQKPLIEYMMERA